MSERRLLSSERDTGIYWQRHPARAEGRLPGARLVLHSQRSRASSMAKIRPFPTFSLGRKRVAPSLVIEFSFRATVSEETRRPRPHTGKFLGVTERAIKAHSHYLRVHLGIQTHRPT